MWTLEKVLAGTYHLNFKDKKDMCKFFMRVVDDDFKKQKKKYTIKEYEEWYSSNYGNGEFTYYDDWFGFCTDDEELEILKKTYNKNQRTDHENQAVYLYEFIKKLENNKSFYIISTCGKSKAQKDTLEHEIAHAMWAKNSEYRKKAKELIKTVPESFFKKSKDYLIKVGYTKKYILDECNAYWSTGIAHSDQKIPHKYLKKFQELYCTYKEKEKKF